jgi:hypothetical protein
MRKRSSVYNLDIHIKNEILYSVFFSDFELVKHPSESELQYYEAFAHPLLLSPSRSATASSLVMRLSSCHPPRYELHTYQ